MTTSNKSGRLLVVDSSTAMLHVLKNFTGKHGYDADHFSDPADACERLDQRFQDFSCDYRSVVLGWPEGRLNLVHELLQRLNSADHDSLPLIIITQEMNADIRALVKRRPKTRVFLWSDYQQVAEIIDLNTTHKSTRETGKTVYAAPSQPVTSAHQNRARGGGVEGIAAGKLSQPNIGSSGKSGSFSLLLVDTAPSICESLRVKLESSGYQVSVADSVSGALVQLADREFDVIVTDFFLRDEPGEALCRQLQTSDKDGKSICVVLTAKYSDSIVKRSLAVGAVACLYKNESTELLFARIDALARTLRRQSPRLMQQPSRRLPPMQTKVVNAVKENQTASLHTATRTELQESREPVNGFGRQGAVKLVARQVARKSTQTAAASTPSVIARKPSNTHRVVVRPIATHSSGDEALPIQGRPAAGDTGPAEKEKRVIAYEATSDIQGSVVSVGDKSEAQLEQVQGSQLQEQLPSEHSSQEQEPHEQTVLPDALDKGVSVSEVLGQLEDRNPSAVYSILMLDIEIVAATGDRMALADSEPMKKLVARSVRKLYPKQRAQACTDGGKFVLLLTTGKFQDALVLARKILQLVPKMVPYLNNMSLVTHAGILRIGQNEVLDQENLIKRCDLACQKARQDGKDNAALVMPNNQYLSATTPESNTGAAHKVVKVKEESGQSQTA